MTVPAPPVRIPTPEELKLMLPQLSRGIIIAPRAGWIRTQYLDAITGRVVTFAGIPTVVALAEYRAGAIPELKAPTITIPTVDVAKASEISIPSIVLPTKVPEFAIPRVRVYLGRFSCGWAIASLCDTLNDLMELLEANFKKVNKSIDAVNDGFKKTNAAVKNLRDKAQDALDTYKTNIEDAVNDGLDELKENAQDALDTYRDNILKSLNTGLGKVIPALYAMIGLPGNHLVSPISTRNIRTDTFEFYALSTGMKLHYVAIGERVIAVR